MARPGRHDLISRQSEVLGRAPLAIRSGRHEVTYWARHLGQEPAQCDLTLREWISVCESSNYLCAYCGHNGKVYPLHMEHIMPLSRGGDHSIENVALACQDCNMKKKQLTLLEWVCIEANIMVAGRGRRADSLAPGSWEPTERRYRHLPCVIDA